MPDADSRGRPRDEWHSGDPVVDAMFHALGHMLDADLSGAWEEARFVIAMLNESGINLVEKAEHQRLVREAGAWSSIAGDLWNELENLREHWGPMTQGYIDEYERKAGIK